MSKQARKCFSLLLIVSLLVGMVGIISVDASYAATKKIHLKKTTVSIISGKTYQQKLIDKKGKTIKATKVKWKSSKTSVAKINNKGKITAVKAGTAKMTAKYNGKTYKFTVKVKKPFSSGEKPKITYYGGYGIYSDTEIAIEWSHLKNATKYQVFVSINDGGFKHVYTSDDWETGFVMEANPGYTYAFKVRGVAGKYYSAFSDVWTEKWPDPPYLKLEKSSFDAPLGETIVINAFANEEAQISCNTSALVSGTYSEKKGISENGEQYLQLTVEGKKVGTYQIKFTAESGGKKVSKNVKLNIYRSPEQARADLRNYIITNGKEVKSNSGIVGDYYIESRTYASSSYNRTVISTYLDNEAIIFYSIDNDDAKFILFHNQPDVQKGIDNFLYNTNQKTSGSLFPIDYWGDIMMDSYSANLYGDENGIANCEKTGPAQVTDTTELYKIYRRASDSMKEFDSFMRSKIGFGIKDIGYDQM